MFQNQHNRPLPSQALAVEVTEKAQVLVVTQRTTQQRLTQPSTLFSPSKRKVLFAVLIYFGRLCVLSWLKNWILGTGVRVLFLKSFEKRVGEPMRRLARSCLQSALKTVNYVLGLVGIGVIMYSLWVIRTWYTHTGDSSFGGPDENFPWFIYTSLGLGISICVITCSGHVAAETANGHCLSCYMIIVFLLIMLEAVITADIFLNRNWEQDFPKDITGEFDELKNFVRSNSELSKWIGLFIVASQALSIFFAMVLRALGPDNDVIDYDSDDDAVQTTLPLLRNQVQQTSYMADPTPSLNNDSWSVRIHEKDDASLHWATTSSPIK